MDIYINLTTLWIMKYDLRFFLSHLKPVLKSKLLMSMLSDYLHMVLFA
ncbi:conserved hypothetical protein [Aeromonas veronii]|uniref:Uncharacterized protein n=1 Tax=Aeromonas veronii TaxID=654 RepID=A0A653KX63_AERVE|nr:conserved hypothetical protein [Aeromonas veronii]